MKCMHDVCKADQMMTTLFTHTLHYMDDIHTHHAIINHQINRQILKHTHTHTQTHKHKHTQHYDASA